MRTALLKVSLLLLILEALALLYPTYLGGYMAIASMINPGIRPWLDIPAGLIILAGLTAGWRLAFWVITNGTARSATPSARPHPAWFITALLAWLFCLAIVALTWLLAFYDRNLALPNSISFTGWLGFLLFTIPYFHILLHTHWTNNRWQKPSS